MSDTSIIRFRRFRVKHTLFILGLLATTGMLGCFDTRTEGLPGPSTVDWDTSFVLDDAGFSRTSATAANSLVRMGDAGRMDAFLRKCDSGGEVRIGFIGGSITAGAKADKQWGRYSTRFCRFLSNIFPHARFKEINAGIGSTDSRYGCSRMGTDLLANRPDLVVLEFAVNDNFRDSSFVTATMEGLIRKSLESSYAPVIIFHSTNRRMDFLNQRFQERLADFYDLPVVSCLRGLGPELGSGALTSYTYFADDVHPTDRGHLAGAYLLFHALATARNDWQAHPDRVWPIVPVPAPTASDFYERSGLMEAGDSAIRLVHSAGWTRSTDALGREGFSTKRVSSSLEFECSAGEMTLGFKVGKDLNATIEVTVDGDSVGSFSNSYPEDPGGGYTRFVLAYRNPDSHAVRTVRVRLISGGTFTIAALLYAGK